MTDALTGRVLQETRAIDRIRSEGWHAQGRLVRLAEEHRGKVGGRAPGEFGSGEWTTIAGDEGEMAERERRS